MKLIKRILIIFAAIAFCSNLTNAQSLSDLLGKVTKSGSGSTIGNVIDGLFTSSNITVNDMKGVWTAKGSAICFKGDDLLKKAGGVAASAALKTKLDPYFKKYGLTGAVLTINADGTFQLKISKVTLNGTITPTSEKGIFTFNFKALNKVNIGKVNTYVQKSSSTMDVMFDASKLMQIVNTVAKVSNISVAKTFSSLLSQYDGVCIGFSTSLTQKIN